MADKKEGRRWHICRGIMVVIAIIGIASFFYRQWATWGDFSTPTPATPKAWVVDHSITITKQWSAPIGAGLSWRPERNDIPFIVEYNTTRLGVVTETYPAIKDMGDHWEPQYKNPEATGVRMRLADTSAVEMATMNLYRQ